MIDDAIDLAKTFRKRNRELKAQVNAAIVGSSEVGTSTSGGSGRWGGQQRPVAFLSKYVLATGIRDIAERFPRPAPAGNPPPLLPRPPRGRPQNKPS